MSSAADLPLISSGKVRDIYELDDRLLMVASDRISTYDVVHPTPIPGKGAVLEEGMFFTIEPMVNLGRPETKTLADDWTAVTRDKSLSAQFEHSIGVTATGCEIFTLSPAGKFFHTR